MNEMPDIMGMASAMARNAETRLGAIATNIANADTPGYRARDAASFSESYKSDLTLPLRATRPGHFSGAVTAAEARVGERKAGHLSPNGNNVSLETEMLAASGVRRDHDTALAIYKSALGILRTSLGRH